MKGVGSFISIEVEFCSYKVWFKKNCNCSYRKSYYIIKISFRNSSTITCGCGWAVRFKSVHRGKYEVSDPVVITSVCGTHYNTCDPSYAKQFVFGWTRSSDYKKCTNVVLKEIMIQMDITPLQMWELWESYCVRYYRIGILLTSTW